MGLNPEIISYIYIYIYILYILALEMAGDKDGIEVEVDDGCIKQTVRSSYYILQYFTVSNSSEAKKGGVKIAVCKFCDKPSVVALLSEQQRAFCEVLY